MADDPHDGDIGKGGFESPLDDLFVEGARFHEPSAAERTEWSKAAHAASKRRKTRERKAGRQTRLRKFAPFLVLGALTLAVLVAFPNTGRNTVDAAGPDQVRVVYAIPTDVEQDDDLVAAIRNEVTVANAWFEEQAGRAPKWVEEDGELVVETQALAVSTDSVIDRPDAGSLIADEFRDENGELPTDEVVVVFVPIAYEQACGETGAVIVVWVGACGDVPSTASAVLDGGVSGTIAHELIHAMGAVGACAPNYGRNGHVIDNPNDIMYDPPEGAAFPAANNLLLDPGNDDYYDHGNGDCPDIKDSPLWD